jgi:hypothetical protein
MKHPTVGDKVRVIAKPSDSPYLTVGHEYPVIDSKDTFFDVIDDEGDCISCIFPKCLHATWEIAE